MLACVKFNSPIAAHRFMCMGPERTPVGRMKVLSTVRPTPRLILGFIEEICVHRAFYMNTEFDVYRFFLRFNDSTSIPYLIMTTQLLNPWSCCI